MKNIHTPEQDDDTESVERNKRCATPGDGNPHFVVLDTLIRTDEPLPMSEIADRSRLDVFIVSEILTDLEQWGSVTVDETEPNQYTVSFL